MGLEIHQITTKSHEETIMKRRTLAPDRALAAEIEGPFEGPYHEPPRALEEFSTVGSPPAVWAGPF